MSKTCTLARAWRLSQPGSVKYLRVVESPEKRFWTGPAWDGGTGQQVARHGVE